MKWTYRLQLDASVDAIYREALASERWFAFDRRYRGLESVGGEWPEVGSTVRIRLAALGPWTVLLKQTVAEHEHGRLLRIHEEALSGLWIDNFELRLEDATQGAQMTITTNATSRNALLRPLVPLVSWILNWLTVPSSLKRFKATVEGTKAEPSKDG
jgi:hypothetical protein